jgi:hypothetical protein
LAIGQPAAAENPANEMRLTQSFQLFLFTINLSMSNHNPTTLCHLCRSLNLKVDTFLDLGYRCPTSLEYDAVDDIFEPDSNDKGRHYVPGECLDERNVYTDEVLAQRLQSPAVVNDFDEDGILISVRPMKKKTLGTLGSVREKASTCALCYLVAGVAQSQGEESDPLHDNARCEIRFNFLGQGDAGMVPSLYQRDDNLKYGRYNCELHIGGHEVTLHPVHDRAELSWFGGRSYPNQVDFNLCKRWMHACETSHNRCGPQEWQRHMKTAPRLRLIDVQDMCLVDAAGDDRYVALSYVWGSVPVFLTKKAYVRTLYTPGGLRGMLGEISLTVQDAIFAVRGLGERYLWTDAICIIQDDPVDKAELVKDMDIVYARAVLTIVAAEGMHANSGLPGVRLDTRKASEAFNVGNRLGLQPTRAVAEILLNCPWSKRAWTFQEGILSSRCLIFTKQAVSFSCCSTTWSEDFKSPNENTAPPWTYAPGTMFDFRSVLSEVQTQIGIQSEKADEDDDEEDVDLLFELWTDVVGNLSTRNLSFESDILFAAAGMISVLQKAFSVSSIYGLPERRLEQFLFWSPMEPGSLRRRRDAQGNAIYPSWSWAGWVGEISWPEHMAGPHGVSNFEIEWSGLASAGKEPVPLQRRGRGSVADDVAMASKTAGNSPEPRELSFPLLRLDTMTTSMCISAIAEPPPWISELQTLAWSTVRDDTSRHNSAYCVTVQDTKDVLGSVVLDSADPKLGHDQLVATFAIVSNSAYQEPQYEGSFGLVYYRVLALRWQGDVAERIGHGAVLMRTLSDVVWQRRAVLLG